jgi:hypothetical protein
MGDWPRRLLHIPTLTSFEWQPGNIYGSFSSPDYAALSYTWGRWMLKPDELPHVEPLAIQGVPWSIPRVRPELFTVEQFQCAIESCTRRRKGDDLEFLWLDIACINQNEDDVDGALEIGRQAKIFGRANQTFVWLASNELRVHADIRDLGADLRFLITYGPFSDGLLPFAKGDMAITEQLSAKDQQEVIGYLEQESRSFARANNALQRITGYPWFSSLWTLQEAFLSPDSHFLSFTGHTLTIPDFASAGVTPTLRDLLRTVHGYLDAALAILNIRTAIHAPSSFRPEEAFKRLVTTTGLDALSSLNPMLLYAQARFRTTSRTEDRVYGIMQVFRLRLGKSTASWTVGMPNSLLDLELQLGAALAEQFPILSQLHIHSRAVGGRQAWRISHTSVSPEWDIEVPFRQRHRHVVELGARLSVKEIRVVELRTGAVSRRVLHGFFQGKTCAFETLARFWMGPGQGPGDLGPLQRDMGFEFQIALDQSALFSKESLGIPWAQWHVPRGEAQVGLVKATMRRFAERGVKARVLLLGGEQSTHITLYGLVVVECHDAWTGPWWARVGICNWQVPKPLSVEALLDPIMMRMKTKHWQRSPVLTCKSDEWIYQEGLFG